MQIRLPSREARLQLGGIARGRRFCNEDSGLEGKMKHEYHGFPAAASVEQAIVLAQLLIRKNLERRAPRHQDRPDPADRDIRPAA